jgi:hypothetical protein
MRAAVGAVALALWLVVADAKLTGLGDFDPGAAAATGAPLFSQHGVETTPDDDGDRPDAPSSLQVTVRVLGVGSCGVAGGESGTALL